MPEVILSLNASKYNKDIAASMELTEAKAKETAASVEAVTELGKDIAMQICALNPSYLDQSQVSAEFIEKEKEIRIAAAKQDPKNAKKPDAIIEKIVVGGLAKMYKEICHKKCKEWKHKKCGDKKDCCPMGPGPVHPQPAQE